MASRGKVDIKNWKKDKEKIYSVNDDITTRLYYSYILSYRRALELKKLWENNNIIFNTDIFEVIVAGSGLYGTDRHKGKDEPKNKRFLIQIIPKIGTINKIE